MIQIHSAKWSAFSLIIKKAKFPMTRGLSFSLAVLEVSCTTLQKRAMAKAMPVSLLFSIYKLY